MSGHSSLSCRLEPDLPGSYPGLPFKAEMYPDIHIHFRPVIPFSGSGSYVTRIHHSQRHSAALLGAVQQLLSSANTYI